MSGLQVNNFQRAAQWLQEADAILLTASNGLSIAEGYHIFADSDAYKTYFGKFREKYGTDCLIRGLFTPMTEADHAEYLAAVHRYLIEDYKGSAVMKDLLALVQNKPYFIVTSNGDTHFQMNGFDAERIFEVEGNFDGLAEQSPAWRAEQQRFSAFVSRYQEQKILLFELGIGSRNQLIKAPTMEMAAEHPSWRFLTMNMPQEIRVLPALSGRAMALTGDIGENFQKLLGGLASVADAVTVPSF